KTREELLRYLDRPNPSTVLILIQGDGDADVELATRSAAVQVDRLSPDRVGRWAMHHAGRVGLTIAPEAVELLVAAVGNDLGALAQELEKLAALAHGRDATRAGVTVGRSDGRTVGLLVATATALLSVSPTVRLSAQSGDPRLNAAVQLAQSGRTDSARAVVRRLLATLSPQDSAYPQALYTQGILA